MFDLRWTLYFAPSNHHIFGMDKHFLPSSNYFIFSNELKKKIPLNFDLFWNSEDPTPSFLLSNLYEELDKIC
jgi:hypothetical protein